jgi:hypothetical protein
VIGFLRVLLRNISGKILIIWDSSQIHHNKDIEVFLRIGSGETTASGATAWLCSRFQS